MQSSADEQLRVEFNEWAREGKGDSMERGHRPVGEQAIARMNVSREAMVLDVGCGSGWAARLIAEQANKGHVIGIDVSDEMVRVAREQSSSVANVEFQVASAEKLPFPNNTFTHAFSMESLYYYADIGKAVSEIGRVLKPGGLFITVVDLYKENPPTHQWIETLKVPVQLLGIEDYGSLLAQAGFENIRDERLFDPRPVPDDYTSGSFKTREDFVEYRKNGSLMLMAEKSI
ncbi:MAG TPA: class I SAM-dependent methyltransferase [Pyrinomonadaceae bacterium]|nr:class I SAM-dependent methyltransferase [Pyrinomonadaceae bacterium]